MSFWIYVTSEAVKDIDDAFNYYNSKSGGLGYRFAEIADIYFHKISQVPFASAIRYDRVRVRPMRVFPFTIHYIVEEQASKVIILRVFNTWQEPIDQP